VLELGVGTGRVAAALAKVGYRVVGVDAMPTMLDGARGRLARLPEAVRTRVELRSGDLRALRLGQRFPLIIAPFNVFQHLYSRRDVERALATCRHHLRARGKLVFDVMLPDPASLAQSPARLFKGRPVFHPGDGRRYEYYEASHYATREQVRTINMLLELPADPTVQRAIPLAHRQFFPAEIEALLHYNGFALEQLYGDFARGDLSELSESQVIIARPRRSR
jgi:SAM-dependent methyltransferase